MKPIGKFLLKKVGTNAFWYNDCLVYLMKISEMITKEKLQEHISKFPNEIHIDDLIDKLVFIDKLEKRIKSSENNEVISEKELENDMEK